MEYPLMIAMLLGLIFRGVAFEFRWRETRHRRVWDIAFASGSIVAARKPRHHRRRDHAGHPGVERSLCRGLAGLA